MTATKLNPTYDNLRDVQLVTHPAYHRAMAAGIGEALLLVAEQYQAARLENTHVSLYVRFGMNALEHLFAAETREALLEAIRVAPLNTAIQDTAKYAAELVGRWDGLHLAYIILRRAGQQHVFAHALIDFDIWRALIAVEVTAIKMFYGQSKPQPMGHPDYDRARMRMEQIANWDLFQNPDSPGATLIFDGQIAESLWLRYELARRALCADLATADPGCSFDIALQDQRVVHARYYTAVQRDRTDEALLATPWLEPHLQFLESHELRDEMIQVALFRRFLQHLHAVSMANPMPA